MGTHMEIKARFTKEGDAKGLSLRTFLLHNIGICYILPQYKEEAIAFGSLFPTYRLYLFATNNTK